MSDDSIDLIRKMLDRDLSTRPTMAEVLTHPVLSSRKLSKHLVVRRCDRTGLDWSTLD